MHAGSTPPALAAPFFAVDRQPSRWIRPDLPQRLACPCARDGGGQGRLGAPTVESRCDGTPFRWSPRGGHTWACRSNQTAALAVLNLILVPSDSISECEAGSGSDRSEKPIASLRNVGTSELQLAKVAD